MSIAVGGYGRTEPNTWVGREWMLPQAPGKNQGTAPGSSTSTSQHNQQSQFGQSYANPELADSVSGNLGNLINQNSQSYNQFVSDPTSHPAFQNALSGMLAALVPSEQAGQRNLMDTFRAAGNTAGSTFGHAAAGYQSDVGRNRQELASNLLAKLYPQIAGAMYAPIGQSSQLLDALKMNQSSSSGSSTSNAASQQYDPRLSNNGGGGSSVQFAGNPLAFSGKVPNTQVNRSYQGGAYQQPMASTNQPVDPNMPDYGSSTGAMPNFGGGGLDWSGGTNAPDISNWDFSTVV